FGPFDLLFDMRYDLPHRLLKHARRSAMLDIDPGQLHIAYQQDRYQPPRHDLLFTIGEKVASGAFRPVAGRSWLYTPPCVFLPEWPVTATERDAPWTTVAHWWSETWMPDLKTGELFCDDKRDSFAAFMDVPAKVPAQFALALSLGDDPPERARI